MTAHSIWRTTARRLRLLGTTVASLMAAAYQPALAQEAAGSVTGIVTVLGSDRPLVGASAVLDESPRVGVSDSSGRYRITGVPPGNYLLTVRRIGFESVSARITVAAGAEVAADVDLKPSVPVQLGEVRVVADSQHWGKLAGMEHRRSINAGGTFITSAELDSAGGRSLPSVLARKLPGARFTMYGRTGGALLSSGRGLTSGRQLPLADPIDPRSPRACYAQVYLDGVRIYSIKNGGMAVPDLREFRVETLAAVEYYAGEAQTPSEFAGEGAACGTIVFWTK
jgi:hypothetical protein